MQKELLSQAFLNHSGTIIEPLIEALEEPLIVASQMIFVKMYHPQIYDTVSSWFFFPLAERYFTLLETYLNTDRSIDAAFVEECGKSYHLINN
jgi:hypothetical protein